MINIDEIIERAPRPKGRRINVTPKKKTKAAVKPKAPSEAELSKALKEFSEQIKSRPSSGIPPVLGSIPGAGGIETINIPGVGQIQLPNVQSGGVETPPNIFNDSAKTETDSNKFDRFLNPYVPDESAVERMTTSDGRVFSGTTVYDRYDPETDTYYGSQGGVMGMIPFSVKGSEMPQSFKDLFQESQKNVKTQPVETLPVEDPLPVETQPTPPPAPPVNPFEGFVPRNIIGPSFDPKDVSAQRQMVADARARMTPGANIQGGGYLTYDNPMLGNKQTQFGGYGQPMPTAPLMNYAGLSSPITYSTPAPDPDAQPGGPPPPQIIR